MADQEVPQSYDPKSILDQVLSKKDDELLPWETVILPSRGLYYSDLVPNGAVQVRAMGIYADKVMATSRLVKTGQALDYIFKHCVRLPNGFDPLDLTSDDRIFLLYYLRGITHGPNYEFFLECNDCGEKSQHEYNLVELWGTKRDPVVDANSIPLREPFTVKLPYLSGLTKQDFWVKVRFLRGRDVVDLLGTNTPKMQDHGGPRKARNRKKKTADDKIEIRTESLDETLENNINRLIVEAMGSTDRDKIKELVSKFHGTDTAAIMDFIRDSSPGIDTMIETDCPHCKEVIAVPLPITDTFFRPKKV